MHIASRESYATTRYHFQIDISINDDFYPGLELVCTPDSRQEIVIESKFGQTQTGKSEIYQRKAIRLDWRVPSRNYCANYFAAVLSSAEMLNEICLKSFGGFDIYCFHRIF